jgi:hypothetical protein
VKGAARLGFPRAAATPLAARRYPACIARATGRDSDACAGSAGPGVYGPATATQASRKHASGDRCLLQAQDVCSYGVRRKRFVGESGVIGARAVVEVAPGGLDVGVAHPFHDAQDVGLGDHGSAKGVAQVVEAQSAQPGALERLEVAAAQRGAVEVAAELAGEDEVVVAGPALALPELGEDRGDF